MARHTSLHSPCVVGFSGGVDSSALLHLLYKSGVRCHVVHVDHGWRQESAVEAVLLGQRVAAMGLPFSCYRLRTCPHGENSEDWSRRERMACFSSAAAASGTDTILLAHQADDQAEVVLKRVLEGASVLKFRGMRPVEKRGGLTILRPLLSIRRQRLLDYLHEESIPYLTDPTNADTHYTRARMREQIFPFLRSTFGKEFDSSLLRIAEEAVHLDQYVQEEAARRFLVSEGNGCAFAAVQGEEEPVPFLVRSLVDGLQKRVGLPSLSRQQVEGIARTFCESPSSTRRFLIGKGGVIVERGWMAAFRTFPEPIHPTVCCGQEGRCTIGAWDVSWALAAATPGQPNDWNPLFSGTRLTWQIPPHPFTVCPSNDQLLRQLKQAARCRPSRASLRPYVPALVQSFRLVADPLSGYTTPLLPGSPCFAVAMQQLPGNGELPRASNRLAGI